MKRASYIVSMDFLGIVCCCGYEGDGRRRVCVVLTIYSYLLRCPSCPSQIRIRNRIQNRIGKVDPISWELNRMKNRRQNRIPQRFRDRKEKALNDVWYRQLHFHRGWREARWLLREPRNL